MATNLLKYPYTDVDDYQGTIVFKVVDEDAIREATQAGIDAGISAGINFADKKYKQVIKEMASGTQSDGTGRDEVPEPSAAEMKSTEKAAVAFKKPAASGMLAQVSNINQDLAQNIPTKNSAQCPYVSLYLPSAFQLADAVSYENFELGLMGAGVEKALKSGASVGGAVMGGLKSSFEALGDLPAIAGSALNITNDTAALVASTVASKTGKLGEGTKAAISSVTGTQLNPNARALFKSVPLRTFNFTFTMIPTNADEANVIKAIVRHFREELYPTGLDMAGINYGYKFPNRFIIETRYKDKSIPGLKFLPAYLQSVNSVYNTQGMGMHEDGNFSSTSITLSFTESKALMKQHIQADF